MKQKENSTTAYFTNIQLLDRNEIIFILINVNVCAFVHDDKLQGVRCCVIIRSYLFIQGETDQP